MNKIIAPLRPTMQGETIADLQDGLLLLLALGGIEVSAAERATFEEGLRAERNTRIYQSITSRLVTLFQQQRQLTARGSVDVATAAALNAALTELGALGAAAQRPRVVSGQVRRILGLPYANVVVRALHSSPQGELRLGEDVTDASGRYTIRYDLPPGVASVNLLVTVSVQNGRLLQSSRIVAGAAAAEVVNLNVPLTSPPVAQRRIEGRVVLEHGLPAEQVALRLYRREFGGAETRLAETTTSEQGLYTLVYDAGGAVGSLELRAVDAAGKEVALSKALRDLGDGDQALVNLAMPASVQAPAAAEYARLVADLKPKIGDLTALAKAKETEDRQDLTDLNRATDWDARLLGLAAQASLLNTEQNVPLTHETLYALLRVGLPSDKRELAEVSGEVFDRAIAKARTAGIVSLSDQQAAAARRQFDTFSRMTRLAAAAPGSRSSYTELLAASGVSAATRESFSSLYLDHRGEPAQLWERAAAAGIAPGEIRALQRQGKLAFITQNNAAVTSQLQRTLGQRDPAELVEEGFYRPERWDAEIRLIANEKRPLGELIPPSYEAENVDERLRAYSQDMARQIRRSYPTHVVGHLVAQDAGDTFRLGAARPATAQLLKRAANRGFRLGQAPVDAFLRDHPDLLSGLGASMAEDARRGMKTLQRVYQITPSNEAMPIMIGLGLTSAYDVVSLSREAFLDRYGHKFPSHAEAELVYRKAEQISSITYNLFTSAKKLEADTPIYGMSAPASVRESAKNELIKHFPTLESLFGSLDFCECEHCRSVLSPAAYLVDLLRFVDAEPSEWESFLSRWRENHSGKEYTETYQKPYDALIERRPDLPHIALTCENTQTALPYIDIVNEILEYYVANGTLSPDAVQDTGSATSAELLAEPQHVIASAYEQLQQARYPLSLPFDLWLETVRRFCAAMETPLWQLLDTFRPGDGLTVASQPYDRTTIFIESLGLSPAEYAIFTDARPLNRWFELYGFENVAAATTKTIDPKTGQRVDLNSAKALARRLGVTYQELADIIQTSFVNPELSRLVILYKLDVSIQDVLAYRDSQKLLNDNRTLIGKKREDLSTSDQQRFDALQPADWQRIGEAAAFEERLDRFTAQYPASGINFRQWINTQLRAKAFDNILLLHDTDLSGSFDTTTLSYPFRKASPQLDADGIAFLKINLFVRLWRKLGWTIDETDRALQTFVPQGAPFDVAHLGQTPLKTALIGIAHLKTLEALLPVGKQRRQKLLTLWSNLATTGSQPLYAQLFLQRSILQSDAVFDEPLGQYLAPEAVAAVAEQRRHEVQLAGIPAANQIDPNALRGVARIQVSYEPLAQVQRLSYRGILSDADKAALMALSSSPALLPLLDAVQAKARAFSRIGGHMLALQGALGLSADEIGQILADAGTSPQEAALSLANVSLLYRYGLLAKALKISVPDLIALKQISGLDPFAPLFPGPLTEVADDRPFTQTIRFVELVGEVRASGLRVEDLDYLLRHRFDQTGKYRPNGAASQALLKTLTDGIRAIRAEHAIPTDPATLSDDVLRQKLGLILPPDIVERFLAMLSDTVEFTVTRGAVPPEQQLSPGQLVSISAIRGLRYDAVLQQQQLTIQGVLFDDKKRVLKERLASLPLAPTAQQLVASLLDDAQAQARTFFDTYLRKQLPQMQPATGFLEETDYGLLFDLRSTPEAGETAQQRARRRRTRLATAFLPFLQQRLIQQFVVQTITAQTGAASTLVEGLLTDTRLIAGPGPLLDALVAASGAGLNATFYASGDGSGTPQAAASIVASADTALRQGSASLGSANSARFEGYLEVPAPGAYRFTVALERKGATAELRFDHLPKPAFLSGTAQTDRAILGNQPDEFLELKAGVRYRFSLVLTKLRGGSARLLVQGESVPLGPVSQLSLTPLSAVAGFERATLLLAKALQLVQQLGLSEREVRYLFTQATSPGGLSLGDLPTQPTGDTAAERAAAAKLFASVVRLAAYTRLKGELAGGTDDLLAVMEAGGAGDTDAAYRLLARLTRRDEQVVRVTARALPPTLTLTDAQYIRRLWEALQIVTRLGAPIDAIVSWTRIVSPAATPSQRVAIARDMREALRARFEPEAWQRMAQPIFDRLRQSQRDALVAHVMHQHDFDRAEQLYEYFLIDPGMEPVVQTSRIRLAIASLQLFIQRCLLNLERKVHPSAITSEHWEWMKRYRVWEANRKIFLFPENWLEPEFRDDKTHLFRDLESALLQGDVSSDLVEDAFFNYLKKLEALARLELVAMHLEESPDSGLHTVHVFGRTFSQPHQYFYRRYARQIWTPWEPVTAEIEGEHLAPVVWRDRLYLFWVTFLDKPIMKAPSIPEDQRTLLDETVSSIVTQVVGGGPKKHVEVQLHWSTYTRGEWSPRESSNPIPVKALGSSFGLILDLGFDYKNVLIHVSKEQGVDGEEGGVFIHLGTPIKQSFYVAGHNSMPERADFSSAPSTPISFWRITTDTDVLIVNFLEQLTSVDGGAKTGTHAWLPILQAIGRHSLLLCNSDDVTAGRPDIAALIRPLFYQDRDNSFFIEPSVTEQTIEEWQEWVTRPPQPERDWERPDWWDDLVVLPVMPPRQRLALNEPKDPIWTTPISAASIAQLRAASDWLINPETGLQFGGSLITADGRANNTHAAASAGAPARPVVSPRVVIGKSGFNATVAQPPTTRQRVAPVQAALPTKPAADK